MKKKLPQIVLFVFLLTLLGLGIYFFPQLKVWFSINFLQAKREDGTSVVMPETMNGQEASPFGTFTGNSDEPRIIKGTIREIDSQNNSITLEDAISGELLTIDVRENDTFYLRSPSEYARVPRRDPASFSDIILGAEVHFIEELRTFYIVDKEDV